MVIVLKFIHRHASTANQEEPALDAVSKNAESHFIFHAVFKITVPPNLLAIFSLSAIYILIQTHATLLIHTNRMNRVSFAKNQWANKTMSHHYKWFVVRKMNGIIDAA